MTQTMRHGRYVKPFPLTRSTDGVGYSVAPHLGKLLEAWRSLNSVADAALVKSDGLAGDPNFTAVGRKTQMRTWLEQEGLKAFRAAREALAEAGREVEATRGQMKRASVDTTDVAGALLRWQIREQVKAMKPSERAAMLAMDDIDPAYALAIVEAPPSLSGVSRDQYERLMSRALDALHPQEAAKLRTYNEAAEAILTAERAAKATIAKAAGEDEGEIERLLGGADLLSKDGRLSHFAKLLDPDQPAAGEPA